MPIYEYICKGCGGQFEIIQGFSDKPKKKCEECGGSLTKLISECAFHLKGSGWYVTDYGNSKRSGSTPSSSCQTKSDDTSGKTKDSAPAATTKSEPSSTASTTPKADQ